MAKECDYCGFRDPMPFTCKFCGRSYCYNHRLPESHDCQGLAAYKEKVRESGKFPYKPAANVKKYRKPFYSPLMGALSVMKSNYSLTILIVVAISFILQYLIPSYTLDLALFPQEVLTRPWTLVTHIFLHSGPIHILFNMMFLFFLGPELERRIGSNRFLMVFFLSGIVAGIGYSLWSVLVLDSSAPAIGASGALFGIFACLTVLAPHMEIYVYFIPMKITYSLIFFALLDLLFIGSGDAIARSAHLSGVLAGLLIGRHLKNTGKYISY
ncbi:MAG: rhomboid family intramembrane serine protease [Candidatus Methanoperedens sp.]|nr:rhomboid family intramembrane serine protease [Candidatus Methanoperedens sp.]MCZ7369186.1 rhomboid family intramembrane serine protease [Candidatus Methanoperedens sp.]